MYGEFEVEIMKKKILSLLLMVLTVLSAVPVLAENVKITVTSDEAVVIPAGTHVAVSNEEDITTNSPDTYFRTANAWAEYIINVEKDGIYQMKFTFAPMSNTGNTEIKIFLDSEQVKAKSFAAEYNIYPVEIGRIHMSEGEHTLRLQAGDVPFRVRNFTFKNIMLSSNELSLENMTKIGGMSYVETSANDGSKTNTVSGEITTGGYVPLHKAHGDYADYVVTSEEICAYRISCVTGSADVMRLNIYVDDVLVKGNIFVSASDGEGSKAYTDGRLTELLTLQISKTQVIRVEVEGGNGYFYGLYFEPNTVKAFAFEYSQAQGNVEVLTEDNSAKSVLLGSAGANVTYVIDAPFSGCYLLMINAKATEGNYINLSLDNEQACSLSLLESETGGFINTHCYLNLKAGENNLKISLASQKVYLKSLWFKKISEDVTKENLLCEKINSASKKADVKNVLEEYGSMYGIDFSEEIKDIFYPDNIYEKLVGRGFSDDIEAIKGVMKLADKERYAPSVMLYKDNEKINSFVTGNIECRIKVTNLNKNAKVIAAVYETDKNSKRLCNVAASEENDGENISLRFDNFEALNNRNYSLKIFNFENIENLSENNCGSVYKSFYISPSGDDENDGSRNMPFKTLKRAKTAVAQVSDSMTGDIVVNIMPGTYYLDETEVFTSEHSGKNGYSIIYRAADAENMPVFSGGRKVTDWQSYKDGIYMAELSDISDVRNLFVNGFAASRARTEWKFEYKEDYNNINDTEYDIDGFVTSDDHFPVLSHPEDAETVWDLVWVCQRIPVENIIYGDETVVCVDGKFIENTTRVTETAVKKEKKYFIENAMELLDEPGEFFYDKRENKIYYYPYNEENLETAETVVPETEFLIDIKGESKTDKVKNIVFENLSFKYGAWNDVTENGMICTQSDWCKNADTGESLMLPPAQFKLFMADNIKISGCSFSCFGSAGVSMRDGVSNVYFDGNTIHDISGTGVIIGDVYHRDSSITQDMEVCRNINITNNVIRRIAQEYRQNVGISVYFENDINISHNDISQTPYTGVSVGWGWDSPTSRSGACRNLNISENYIHDVMGALSDGGNIYTLGHIYDSTIANNHLGLNREKGNYGIYLDAGSSYLNVHGNVITDVYDTWLFMQTAYSSQHNKVYNNFSTVPDFLQSGTIGTNQVEDVNVFAKDNPPSEAEAIIKNAGVGEKYISLISKTDYPEWRNSPILDLPKQKYADGIIIEAEDFEACFDPSTEVVTIYPGGIISFNSGEWTEYKFNAEKTGLYELSIYGGTVEKVPIRVDINGQKALKLDFIATGGFNTYQLVNLGYVALNKGENTIRVSNLGGGMHFDWFLIK